MSHACHKNVTTEKEIEKESEIDIEIDSSSSAPGRREEGEEEAPGTAIVLPLGDGGAYPVDKAQVEAYRALYPKTDVMAELRHIKGWLSSHPGKYRTPEDLAGFISVWLIKEERKGGTPVRSSARASPAPAIERNYDLDAAMEQMHKQVPKLKKRPKPT